MLEWEWYLASGAKVRAGLDLRDGTESVWLDQRLVSRAAAGRKPEGHTIAGGPALPYRSEEVRVVFHRATQTCALLVGGSPIPAIDPDAASAAGRVDAPSPHAPPQAKRKWTVPVVLLSLVAVWGITSVIATKKRIDAQKNAPLSEVLQAPNGLMVAHYPSTFFGSVVDQRDGSPVSQLKIATTNEDASVYLSALPHPVSSDPEELSRVIMTENTKTWATQNATFREKRSGHETCLGEQGFVMEGVVNTPSGKVTRWACAFIHNGRGYSFVYLIDEANSTQGVILLRRIINATELTDRSD
jgi:hypothetical protein